MPKEAALRGDKGSARCPIVRKDGWMQIEE